MYIIYHIYFRRVRRARILRVYKSINLNSPKLNLGKLWIGQVFENIKKFLLKHYKIVDGLDYRGLSDPNCTLKYY